MSTDMTPVADIIEPHIDGRFKRRDRALGAAEDLRDAGLLACSPDHTVKFAPRLPGPEAAVNLLQCRLPWSAAEAIAAELADAGLLRENRGER